MSFSSPPDHNENFAERAERLSGQVKDAQQRGLRNARDRERHQRDKLALVSRNGVALCLLGLSLLLIDGMRRENEELSAHLLSLAPAASIRRFTETKTQPAHVNTALGYHDVLYTNSGGRAMLAFPDGSGVLVLPQTRFEVRAMDYARTGRRSRSFFLRSGNLFSRVSKAFGSAGQTLITTPNAITSSRGAGYTVHFAPDDSETTVEVIEGKAVLKNDGGRIEIVAGQQGIATGGGPPQLATIDGNRCKELRKLLSWTRSVDRKPLPLTENIVRTERGLLSSVDPLFQLVGLIPGGWNVQDNDTARCLKARERLLDLQKAFADEVPDHLTPHSLAEVSLPEEDRQRILNAFSGEMFDFYQKSGNNGYVVRARARDTRGTAYELTENGIKEIKP